MLVSALSVEISVAEVIWLASFINFSSFCSEKRCVKVVFFAALFVVHISSFFLAIHHLLTLFYPCFNAIATALSLLLDSLHMALFCGEKGMFDFYDVIHHNFSLAALIL